MFVIMVATEPRAFRQPNIRSDPFKMKYNRIYDRNKV